MSTKAEIAKQFITWNQALQTGEPDKVVACYAEDAILVPTLSAKVRHNHDEIRNYFEHFLTKNPRGKIVEENIRIYDDVAINSGIYTFYLSEDEIQTDTDARFTFVYRKQKDRWMIVEHHSSLLPK